MPKGIKGFQKGHPNYLLHHTEEAKKKMSEAKKGKRPYKMTDKIRKNMSDANFKNPRRYWLGKKRLSMTGENHYRWIKDRNLLQRYNDDNKNRRSSVYRDWRNGVWKRDNWKCKINNNDCSGKIIAHHILSWRDYPELRYNINNGITLCHAHHPLRRTEEKRLIPFFSGLVPVSNELI